MVVDEGWRYLRDPVMLGRLTEAARTWRKRNAALILATQSVTDITEAVGEGALLESMPTRLFLANPDFPEAGQATFQLSDDELRTVRELEPKRELYVRRPTTAAVLRLAVDPESYWLYTSSAGEAQRRAEMVARYGVQFYRLEAWKTRALAGLELGLKAQAGEPLAAELDAAKRHIGELSMENELLRERARAAERRLPLATRRSRRSAERPPRRRGGAMVSSGCVDCGNGRARRSTRGGPVCNAQRRVLARGAAGRRPRCRMRSCWRPFAATWPAPRSRERAIARSTRGGGSSTGSGSPGRACCAMRAQGLLSPHRGRPGDPKAHDGTIVTSAPDVMCGAYGVRVFTADEGWVWTFAAVDHWNAKCVGWHVCKVGSRFAALEPVAPGLRRLYGSVEADVARGLALRMDHGSQYLSDHFLNQLRYWGIHPSFGFLDEPETDGVVERWNRTLKEQAVYGRVFRNLADVRAALARFVEHYNQCWRLEKLAYRTPLEAREDTSCVKPRSVNVCPRNRVQQQLQVR